MTARDRMREANLIGHANSRAPRPPAEVTEDDVARGRRYEAAAIAQAERDREAGGVVEALPWVRG